MAQLSTATRPLVARAGRHIVELTQPNRNIAVWRVEVSLGGNVPTPVGELTRSFPFEGLARAVYKALENALAAPGATVKTARRAVVRQIDDQIDWLFMQPGIAGRAEKVEILQTYRAGFAMDDDLTAVS